jgi:DNA polymerase I - 3''-5'' exonuclease and polymerase domains
MKRLMSVDVETYDPNLKDLGDGSCRDSDSPDNDNSCLLCVGTFDGQRAKAYMPFTEEWHEFVELMEEESIDKVFHNGIYDLSWLTCGYDVNVRGLCHDTMTRMTYIDEYAELNLDACCRFFKIQGKNKADTIEAWYDNHKADIILTAQILGHKIKKVDDLWKHSLFLWNNFKEFREKMIEYNLQDCRATYNLYFAQEPRMQKVYDAYMVDVKLTPLIVQMKKRGVLIDKEKMQKLADTIQADYDDKVKILTDTYGVTSEVLNSPKQLGARLNEMGIHSPVKTKTGAESWGADAMARLMHYPVIPLIVEARGYNKLLGTYMHGGMADAILSDGRIHCTFSPNKREDGGTVTGRFACAKPNLQQIPARDKAVGHSYGQAMRELFLPEDDCMMSALDYSQIEYLLLGHFAQGQQAAWFREQAKAGVDFHTVAMQATGIPSRQVVKTFNYGVIYGMGWFTAMTKNYVLFEKMAEEHGMNVQDYTHKVYDDYHARLPVIRDTMKVVNNIAQMQGYVMTIGGRYQHKPKPVYDPATGKMQDFIYKMLNKLIQGSAADILKFALLEAWESGVFDVLKMHLTVHDENVVSVPYNKIGAEANGELKHIMDMSFHDKLKVPMKAACELGPNWGYWSGDIWEDMQKGIFNRQADCWWGKKGA